MCFCSMGFIYAQLLCATTCVSVGFLPASGERRSKPGAGFQQERARGGLPGALNSRLRALWSRGPARSASDYCRQDMIERRGGVAAPQLTAAPNSHANADDAPCGNRRCGAVSHFARGFRRASYPHDGGRPCRTKRGARCCEGNAGCDPDVATADLGRAGGRGTSRGPAGALGTRVRGAVGRFTQRSSDETGRPGSFSTALLPVSLAESADPAAAPAPPAVPADPYSTRH
jgi:hypothetical protein